MDTVTHGIAGALLGKGLFSKRQERVAIFAATLGAVFPDSDVVAEIVSRDPLGIIKYHRAITHSFIAMPFFAAIFAWLTPPAVNFLKRRYPKFSDLESPSWAMLPLIYAVGIASHILLDAMTSFGTRMWYPLSSRRVAWDLLFIIDFTFTSLVLLPQIDRLDLQRSREEPRARRANVDRVHTRRARGVGAARAARDIRSTFGSWRSSAPCWLCCFSCPREAAGDSA